jgi:hypothetical protein
VFVDGGGLPGQADAFAHLVRIASNVESCDLHGPLVGLQQGRQDADRGRLPGAVRAEEAEDGPLRDHHVEAVERDNLVVSLDQPLRADHVAHKVTSSLRSCLAGLDRSDRHN